MKKSNPQLDFNNPRSIITLYPPIQKKGYKGYVCFFGYRFKEHKEVSRYFKKQEYDEWMHSFSVKLNDVGAKKWIGKHLIEKALEKIKSTDGINVIKPYTIDLIMNPKSKNKLDSMTFGTVHSRLIRSLEWAYFDDIKKIAMIKDYVRRYIYPCYFTEPASDKEKIWFKVDWMSDMISWVHKREQTNLPISDDESKKMKEKIIRQIQKEKIMVDKMIESYNKTGDFNIKEIAGIDEPKYRKHFKECLMFRDFTIYNEDAATTYILLVDENILLSDEKKRYDSTLIKTINRLESLLEVLNIRYKIFCFTSIEKNDSDIRKITLFKKKKVSVQELIASEKFQNTNFTLPLALGKTTDNVPYIVDFRDMHHLFIAGDKGCGKSLAIHSIISSLRNKKDSSELKFVYIEPKNAIQTLDSLCIEKDSRWELIVLANAKYLEDYNEKFSKGELPSNLGHRFLPNIVVIIDNFEAVVFAIGEKNAINVINRLTWLARAAGIQVVIAISTPFESKIYRFLKVRFSAFLTLKISKRGNSRFVLGNLEATKLAGKGEMVFSERDCCIHLQGAFVPPLEIEDNMEYIAKHDSY